MKGKAKQFLHFVLRIKNYTAFLLSKLIKKHDTESDNTIEESACSPFLPLKAPLKLISKSVIKDHAPVKDYIVIKNDTLIIYILWSERYRFEQYEILAVPKTNLMKQCPLLN